LYNSQAQYISIGRSVVQSVTLDCAEIRECDRQPRIEGERELDIPFLGLGWHAFTTVGSRIYDGDIEISPLRAQNCVPASLEACGLSFSIGRACS